MKTNTSNQITTWIFVGIEIGSEVKMRLYESHAWKDAQLIAGNDPLALKEVHYQGKNYIGRMLSFKEVTIKDLDKEANEVIEKLTLFCPLLKLDKNKIIIFPQVFVA